MKESALQLTARASRLRLASAQFASQQPDWLCLDSSLGSSARDEAPGRNKELGTSARDEAPGQTKNSNNADREAPVR